jgi:hypothetical protein
MESKNLSLIDLEESSQKISRMWYPELAITKEQLEYDFFTLGLDSKQIAVKYSCHFNTIRRYAKNYGIKRPKNLTHNSREGRLLVINNISLTQLQESILVGSVLGDGRFDRYKPKWNAYFCISQIWSRKEYLEWIASELSAFISRPVYQMTNSNAAYLQTMHCNIFNKYHDLFYINGKKGVPSCIKNYLNLCVLARWFEQDGHTEKSCSTISTCSFSVDECNLLVDSIKDVFNISPFIKMHYDSKYDKYYPLLCFNSVENRKLHSIIDPIFHPCFNYKKLNIISSTTNTQDVSLVETKIEPNLGSDDERL